MSTTLTVQEAQGQLAKLLELARTGHDVFIHDAHSGKARLVPVIEPTTKPRVLGLHAGQWTMAENWDAPVAK